MSFLNQPFRGSTSVAGLIGAALGIIVAMAWNPFPLLPPRFVPKPYTVARLPGGTGLRMAMVHDILHERYLRHGDAWYTARNAQSRTVLEKYASETKPVEWFDASDDLAVGLDRLGKPSEAIEVMRRKLAALPPEAVASVNAVVYEANPKPRSKEASDEILVMLAATRRPAMQMHVYTTEANLGTELIHANVRGLMSGDAQARSSVEEGVTHIIRALEINPAAHFGREIWQALAVNHLLALRPADLLQTTLVGEELNSPIEFKASHERPWTSMVPDDESPASIARRCMVRQQIPPFLPNGPVDDASYALRHGARLDEPVLGLVGMWTLGGGPSAHSAVALGRLMEDFGEYSIAWNAYQRAIELKTSWWPDEAQQNAMVAWCKDRQAAIAAHESPDDQSWPQKMLKQHEAELAWGIQYQKEYHDFEAAQIAKGVPLNDPHFYDAFFAGRQNIASDPGASDDVEVDMTKAESLPDFIPAMVLGAGLFILLHRVKGIRIF